MVSRAQGERTMIDVLVVGSNEKMISQVEEILVAEGMRVIIVEPHDVLSYLDEGEANIVVLDMDGNRSASFDLCRGIRDRTTAPLLVLSENGQDTNLAQGLENGADAHLLKPFTIRVFLAQVYSLLRRIGLFKAGHAGQLEANGLVINLHRREVSVYGRPVKLTPTEYKLLGCLVQNSGRALSYRTLVKEVQGYDCGHLEARDIIKVHIHNLRRKIEPRLNRPRFIRTVRDFGFVFERRSRDREELELTLPYDE